MVFVEKIEPPLTANKSSIPASSLIVPSPSLTSSLSINTEILIYEDQDTENIASSDCKHPDTPTIVNREQRSVLGEFQVFEDDAELKFVTPGKNIVYQKG